jgi:mitogen-activated protein kinase organizer 1
MCRRTQITYAGVDDSLLVTAGYDQCVKVWDCRAKTYDAIQVMKVFKVR